MSDVNDLLARLKMPSATESGNGRESGSRSVSASGMHHPQPTSLLASLAASSPPARSQSLTHSQQEERTSADRATNLLNLLKFNQPSTSTHLLSTQSASGARESSTPPQLNPTLLAASQQHPASQHLSSTLPKDTQAQSQDALLKLLNRPSTTTASAGLTDSQVETDPANTSHNNNEDKDLPEQSNTELDAIAKYVSEQENQPREQAQQAVQEVAEELQHELQKKGSQLRESMPTPMADAFEKTVETVVQQTLSQDVPNVPSDSVPASLPKGSFDPEPLNDTLDTEPKVYQFPMRPFVAININSVHPPARRVREDLVIKVAALKRDFDQNDRTLAVATSNFIVYAMLDTKGGGIRVIRQDEGTSNHVFKKVGASIFNVNIASPKGSGGPDVVLATDVNGSVYWTSASALDDPDKFPDQNLENKGFIFPPLPSQDDNTSGAQLKTRAKLSSRHPDFFAVGRGKSIHIIRPEIALDIDAPYINPVTRTVDSEKLLTEQCMKIATGKAGKDFSFSEDDSLIVSLDKAGRLKFWDIRPHTDPKTAVYKARSFHRSESKTPLLTLPTCGPNDKSWATSVNFVDKERPMAKGQALRYLIVGSKQNHTIQLWDLGLGKPVQEINFPHENEMDAICSVVYHPRTGILTVGHPTRNSVYLIHVSAPRYNLPSGLTQADYVRRLSEKDPTIPYPESTAIMSGMREISLSSIGQLRSLSVLSVPMSTSNSEEVETVLELYIMHSKGLTSLTLTRQDIGIGMDGRPIYPVDAESEERISVSDLKAPPSIEDVQASEISSKSEADSWRKSTKENGGETGKEITSSTKAKTQSAKAVTSSTSQPKEPSTFAEIVQANPTDQARALTEVSDPNADITAADISKMIGETSRVDEPSNQSVAFSQPLQDLPKEIEDRNGQQASSMRDAISQEITKVFDERLDKLFQRIDQDKRVQDAAGAAKQEAVLRLVSKTLEDNVEKNLNRIIKSSMTEFVVPSISGTIESQLDGKISTALNQHLQSILSRELKSTLPSVVNKTLQAPEFLRGIVDLVSAKVSTDVEAALSTTFEKTIVPNFRNLSTEAASNMGQQLQSQMAEQIRQSELQHRHDSAKIDQLTNLTGELVETVKALASTQSLLQREIAQLQAKFNQQPEAGTAATSRAASAGAPRVQRDAEVDEIGALMTTGRFEEGTIKWLQSARQAEIFDKLFVQMTPSYLRSCNQIVILSVSAAVTAQLESNLPGRLSWLETALSTIDTHNTEIAEHVPGVMDALTQRLQDCYMAIAESNPSNPVLPKIHSLVRQSKDIKALMTR